MCPDSLIFSSTIVQSEVPSVSVPLTTVPLHNPSSETFSRAGAYQSP